jgi:RNA polymerase sigma-70 factor (ECF subfamily)
MLGNASDADEVVHDVFLYLFEEPSRFAGTSRLSTYLYRAVTNACLNRIRNARARQRLVAEQQHGMPMHDPGGRAEWSASARALLRRLPEPLAAVAVYRFIDELSQREIGSLLGCSHSHVGVLLQRLEDWIERERSAC